MPPASFAAPVNCVRFSSDSRLASGTSAGYLHIHDPVTGDEFLAFKCHEGMVYDLMYTPDGRRLARLTFDGWMIKSQVNLSEPESGKHVFSLPGVLTVAFSVDGRTLATSNWKSFQPNELRV